MAKLTDTQAMLLSSAAARPDLSVLPIPETLKTSGAALDRTLCALIRRGFVSEESIEPDEKMRARGRARGAKGGDRRLTISDAGLAAIGAEKGESAAPAPAVPPPAEGPAATANPIRQGPGGKLGLVLKAVSAPDGASIEDLTRVSGWLPHTTRAALTQLRRRGYAVSLTTIDGRRAYRLAETA